ncbi:MAG: 2-amino-4-hydroxy-6-hydroxymethyldihydropteridine diphosphokinase [Paracoccaceae bacterium]
MKRQTGQRALIALGANLPFGGMTPSETLREALASLVANGQSVVAKSRFFQTPCFPAGAGPDYVNAACVLQFSAESSPQSVLKTLHKVENAYGRKRDQRWGMRTLDLDLIAFGDSVLPDVKVQTAWRNLDVVEQRRTAPDQLILPHPRLQDRAFVLVPLADVAADWRHPVLGVTISEMLAALPEADRAAMVPLPD